LRTHGAIHASAVEARPHSFALARELAEEAGVADRLGLEVANFAERAVDESYDVVILDRVVCCYPVWQELLRPAAAAARVAVALSYPRQAWWTRAFFGLANTGQWLLRRRFRLYLHPPAEMQAALRADGFLPRVAGHVGPWELLVAPRAISTRQPSA
ncbi:MAG: hypothetical protein HY703_03465, partial [Gemmatimonadetes bacterium]|nr:hypothetical protein [Gemmatimonadota bacterium]